LKDLIKIHFSRFAESYDKEADLQKKSARILINYAKELNGKILDLGCGTSFLYRFSNWNNLIGIDISKEMVSYSLKFNKNTYVADMEDIPFKDNSFESLVSNFSIHWSDINKTFKEAKRVLKPGGRFVFNIPVVGSLETVEKILGKTQFDFLCVPEILKKLKLYDFRIKDFFIENLSKEFPNGYKLLMHLHKTGVAINTNSKNLGEKRKIVKKFKNFNTECQLNFKLLFVDCLS